MLGERRLAMDRGRDGVWRIEGRPSWRNAEYAYAVTVYVPDEVVTNVVTDPYSLGLTLNSRRSLLVDLDDRELAPRGWDRLRKPELDQPEDSTIYELHVRDFSITDETVPARRSRHLPRVHARRQRRHAPPAPARRQRHELAAPAADQRHRDDRGGPLAAAGAAVRPRLLPARLRGAAGLHRPDPRPRRLQLGLRPAPLHDARGLVLDPSGRHRPHARVPRDGHGRQPRRPARRDGRRLQPHAGRRAGPEVDPRPDRPRLLPPAEPGDRRGRDLDLLLQHRDRAPHDGEADGRVGRDLGARVQGRRLPLRPHGPPLEGQHAQRAPGARRSQSGATGSTAGGSTSTARAGTSARWRTTRASCRPASSTWQAPGSARSRTACATPSAAAGRSTPTRGSRASPAASSPIRTAPPVNGTPEQQRARLLLHHDQIKVGLAGNLRDYRFVDRTGATVTGAQVDYNGQPAGYAAEPDETITYVDAHDNETLFDVLQYKLPRRGRWPTGCG